MAHKISPDPSLPKRGNSVKWPTSLRKESKSVSCLTGIIFLGSLIFLSFSLLKGFDGGIVDMHGFRQTQTAITVRYLLKGGPWLAYETPVLGPPWSIPFEFPLYQWLVALTAQTGFFPLEQAGRVVGIFFFLSTLYPFYKILRTLSLKTSSTYLVLSLYCLSPQYLFWSRTFMIESTALSLSMYYLWFSMLWDAHTHSAKKDMFMLSGLAVSGSLAAAVKITTFFPFWTAAFGLFLWRWLKATDWGKRWERSRLLPVIQFLAAAFLIPLAALLCWTSYSDALKSLNPLAQTLTSSALREWNFGSLPQRLAPATWKIFFSRTITDLIGNRWLLAAAVLSALFCRRDRRITFFVFLLLFIIPLLTFTNLYLIHNYYAYANGVFLIAAVGVASSGLLESRNYLRRAAGGLLACSIIVFSVHHYLTSFYPVQGMTIDASPVKNEIGLLTKDSDVIVVFSDDWSSEIPYYLDRRAVMFGSNDLAAPSFQKTKQNLRGYRIGAIIFTNNADLSGNFVRNALSQFGFSAAYPHIFSTMAVYYNPYIRFR
jgi:hypothetical protein